MKKLNPSLFLLLSVPLLTTLTASKPAEKANVTTGTYGVYNSSNSIALISLQINDDFTFSYVNKSNPAKPIKTTGYWKLNGNTIVLDNFKSAYPINTKWAVDKNQQCLKSRKGLEFTRLCLINTTN